MHNKKHNILNTSTDKIKTENENKIDISDFSDISAIKDESPEENKKNDKFALTKRFTIINSQKNLTIYKDLGKSIKRVKSSKRTGSLTKNELDEIVIENDNENIENNPLLINVQEKIEGNDIITEDNIEYEFHRINMMPRTIDDIIRKEKVSFGYINHNLLIMFLLLFFNNMIKENCISFFSYYIADKESFFESEDDSKNDLPVFLLGLLIYLD